MSGLRVLHIDSGREWRGGQRQVLLLADGLRARGHEPLVVAQPSTPLLHRLRGLGIAAVAVPMRADWDLLAARRIRLVVRTWRPDIVHAHDARAHAIAIAALTGRRRRTPLLVTRRVPFRPKAVRLKYGDRVSHFIAISVAVRDALISGGVSADRITVVHSGVPSPGNVAARDWRAECGWPADTVICGVVGAMTAEKGIGVLARVAAHLSADVRERVRLVLLGGAASGTTEIGGIPAYRAGFVHEVHSATAGLDVLWHPSSAEGLGTAVIDAMALGVPPVAFAVGGLPELIEADTSGLLAPAGDVEAFAVQATRLVNDSQLRSTLGAAGRHRARDFGSDAMVDGTVKVYGAVRASNRIVITG